MSVEAVAQPETRAAPALQMAFQRWQCRVRQISARDNQGQPDEASMPTLTLEDEAEAMGHIVTVLCKSPDFSITPELQHMYRCTQDPVQRRKKAIQYLGATHYQKPGEFSDTLTATFSPHSPGAKTLFNAGACTLLFDAYGQRFILPCQISELSADNALFQATWWHNALFNANLPLETVVLAFTPDWDQATADPEI